MGDPLLLTQELLTITNYTRAAYGYVMAAGGGVVWVEGVGMCKENHWVSDSTITNCTHAA
jgi:hypothetical protein